MANMTTLSVTSDANDDDYLLVRQEGADYKQTRAVFCAAVLDNTTVDSKLTEIGMDYYKYATDRSGTANTITIAIANSENPPSAPFDGMVIRVLPANANTGAVTVTYEDVSYDLSDVNGGDLASGILSTSLPVTIRYDGTLDKFVLDDAMPYIQSSRVKIGLNAGLTDQGNYSIAIGDGAGQTDQPANSICLLANGGTAVSPTSAGDILIKTISHSIELNSGGFYIDGDVLDTYIFEATKPIGTVYTNYSNSDNPSTYLTGASDSTWVAIAGRVVVGVGTADSTTFSAQSTGGKATVTLTTSQMPAHTHTGSTASAGGHTHTITSSSASAGAHTHTITSSSASAGGHTHTITSSSASNGAHTHTITASTASSGSHTHTASGTAASAGAHTHSTTGTAASAGAHSHTYTAVHTNSYSSSNYYITVGGSGSGVSKSVNSAGAHTHDVTVSVTSAGAHTHTVSASSASAGAHTHTITSSSATAGAHTHTITSSSASAGSHTHTITSSSATAGAHTHTVSITSTGGGEAHTNLQPYITCYVWRRTA